MQNFETIEIKFNIIKSILALFACALFTIIGINFVVSPGKFVSVVARNPVVIFVAGCASILFFGVGGLLFLKRLFKNEPALIISAEGITNNLGGSSLGLIPWSDITSVREQVVANQKIIILNLKNPQQYVDRQRGRFKRKIMRRSQKIFGTGIGISTNALKISHKELKQILEERLFQAKNKEN